MAGEAAKKACVAAGGDGHVIPAVSVTADDVADAPTSAQVHSDRPTAAAIVGDGQVDRPPRLVRASRSSWADSTAVVVTRGPGAATPDNLR